MGSTMKVKILVSVAIVSSCYVWLTSSAAPISTVILPPTVELIQYNKYNASELAPNHMIMIDNNESILPIDFLNNLIDGSLQLIPDEAGQSTSLVGISLFKDLANQVHTDYYFSNRKAVSKLDLLELANSNARKYSKEVKFNQVKAATNRYADGYNWFFYDQNNSNVLAGTYTSNVDYIREGTGNLNGKQVSVWNVKYFNSSKPRNNYQTRQVVTRSSVQAFDNETLRNYGPYTTSKNESASVSLTGIVPTFSWNFDTASSRITDSSDLVNHYARWTFDVSLGSGTAIYTYSVEPGARYTNAVGNFGIEHSHTLNFYKNLSANKIGSTGIVRRFLPDL